jgi:hypothetical protein
MNKFSSLEKWLDSDAVSAVLDKGANPLPDSSRPEPGHRRNAIPTSPSCCKVRRSSARFERLDEPGLPDNKLSMMRLTRVLCRLSQVTRLEVQMRPTYGRRQGGISNLKRSPDRQLFFRHDHGEDVPAAFR